MNVMTISHECDDNYIFDDFDYFDENYDVEDDDDENLAWWADEAMRVGWLSHPVSVVFFLCKFRWLEDQMIIIGRNSPQPTSTMLGIQNVLDFSSK